VKNRFQNLPFKCDLQRYKAAEDCGAKVVAEVKEANEAGLYKFRV
jgi:hypothetical protein